VSIIRKAFQKKGLRPLSYDKTESLFGTRTAFFNDSPSSGANRPYRTGVDHDVPTFETPNASQLNLLGFQYMWHLVEPIPAQEW
jgi:hypothetical protein